MSSVVDEQLLSRLLLDSAKGAAYYSDNSRCLPETRVSLRTELINWTDSDDLDTKGIFWISGMAGMGKSTIARTVAEHCNDRGHLVASFFFARAVADRSDIARLVSTIACQLADASTILKRQICRALSNCHDHSSHPLAEQWKLLIKQPLQELEHPAEGVRVQPPTLVLVVDALDECSDDKGIVNFLRVLEGLKEVKFVRFRVLITSRDVPVVLEYMGMLKENTRRCNLSEVSQGEIEGDLRNFYFDKLCQIKEKYFRRRRKQLDDWPKGTDVARLVNQTDGLFQYAEVACRVIGGSDGSPANRLEMLLNTRQSGGLDEIYSKALELSIPTTSTDDRNNFFQRFRQVVGAIVLSFDPLSRKGISHLLQGEFNDSDVVADHLDHLHSVLYVPEAEDSVIRVIHLSFRDFLTEKRCKILEFQIDKEEVHERLFRGCIALMSSSTGLRKDICDLKAPGTRIVERKEKTDGVEVVERIKLPRIELEVQYACRFWVNHLGQIKYKPDHFKLALEFLKGHFLHWLEALSLMGKTSEGVLAVISLESLVIVSDGPSVLGEILANLQSLRLTRVLVCTRLSMMQNDLR